MKKWPNETEIQLSKPVENRETPHPKFEKIAGKNSLRTKASAMRFKTIVTRTRHPWLWPGGRPLADRQADGFLPTGNSLFLPQNSGPVFPDNPLLYPFYLNYDFERCHAKRMNSDLSRWVLDFANRLEIQPVHPSRLLPLREAILAFRAKNYSYERIVGFLKPQGIIISGSSVGAFCRKHCPASEATCAKKCRQRKPFACRTGTTACHRQGSVAPVLIEQPARPENRPR